VRTDAGQLPSSGSGRFGAKLWVIMARIDLADSLDHLRANEKHGLYQAEVARFRSRIVGHPHREFFRVVVSKGIKGGVEMLEDAG
jgi:hypothetical protein